MNTHILRRGLYGGRTVALRSSQTSSRLYALPNTTLRKPSGKRWFENRPPSRPSQYIYGDYRTPKFQQPQPHQQRQRQDQQQQGRQDEKEQENAEASPFNLFTAFCIFDFTIAFLADRDHDLQTKDPLPYLNATNFTKHVVTAVEPVSSTAFILTVQPRLIDKTWRYPKPLISPTMPLFDLAEKTAEVYREAWEHGLWAVEIKQPQLQIAREYTPLPPNLTSAGVAKSRLEDGKVGAPADGSHRDGSFSDQLVSDSEGSIERNASTELRFLVRTVKGGEVSNYLSGLRVGDELELRGPRLSFDVRARMGSGRVDTPKMEQIRRFDIWEASSPFMWLMGKVTFYGSLWEFPENKRRRERPIAAKQRQQDVEAALDRAGTVRSVVFLAGGTGISSALQACKTVLEADENRGGRAKVTVLWANRNREDCVGCDKVQGEHAAFSTFGKSIQQQASTNSSNTNAPDNTYGAPAPEDEIMRLIYSLQARHPGRLDVQCVVDAEGTSIDAPTVRQRIAEANALNSSGASDPHSHQRCHYHSPQALSSLSDDAPPAPTKDIYWGGFITIPVAPADPPKCSCKSPPPPGKNLVIVSGPEGFVSALAGPKRWSSGRERQGTLDGVLGEMEWKERGWLKDWLVLKL